MKTIIDAVDRHGLKRRILRKYGVLVKRLYRQLIDVEYQSAAATACKERFQRNRNTLFTFLEHDGVPWNNNNAEHTIKAFAMLRKVIGGTSTDKGIREYLTLFSICENLQIQGSKFPGFFTIR